MMLSSRRHEKNVAFGKENPRFIENQRAAAREYDVEFILLVRVLVVPSLGREQDHRH